MNTAPNQPTPTPAADPWTVKPAGNDPLPPAAYMAVFAGVEDYANPEKTITDKWRWTWAVKAGAHAGKPATALTDRVIKPTTLPGRLISGMAGRALTDGENVRKLVDGFKGKTFIVTVGAGPKGGKAQVQSASLPPEM